MRIAFGLKLTTQYFTLSAILSLWHHFLSLSERHKEDGDVIPDSEHYPDLKSVYFSGRKSRSNKQLRNVKKGPEQEVNYAKKEGMNDVHGPAEPLAVLKVRVRETQRMCLFMILVNI